MTTACLECGKLVDKSHVGAASRKRAERSGFCNKTCSNRWNARNRTTTKYRRLTTRGYVEVWKPDHPMAQKSGYMMEHRLLMAEHLGRMLTRGEVVHHLNEDRTDNRLENLELMGKMEHDKLPKPLPRPFPCPHCAGLIQTFGTHSRVRIAVAVAPPPR